MEHQFSHAGLPFFVHCVLDASYALMPLYILCVVFVHQDYDFLKTAGVLAIFGPGTTIPSAAKSVLEAIRANTPK
jgi:methylmalonyl-CoA mutase cobalamin-binding domain/chain